MRIPAFCCALSVILAGPVAAETLVSLDRPELYDLQVAGFELPRDAELNIEAVGMWEPGDQSWFKRWFDDDKEILTVSAWLLDSATREPVWVMELDDSSRVSRTLREAENTVSLDAGRYELYLFSGYARIAEIEQRDEDREEQWWQRMFSDRRGPDEIREDLEQCRVQLSTQDLPAREVRLFDVTGDISGSLVQLNRNGDSRFVASGFALDRPARLRVYTLFESTKNAKAPADYGWIVNADTRELAWHPDDSRSRAAGGGEKNRLIDDQIELDSGRYIVYYGTDDSHSFNRFNTAAPQDPFNWGITLMPGDGFDPSTFSRFEPADEPQALVEYVRAGDDAFFEQAFRLQDDATLLVRALGEYDYGDEQFYDRAWIVDARSNEVVWEMEERNTIGAGGAEKNRMFDGALDLAAGEYIVSYASDGSHSYESWNGATPFDPEAWGIALRPGPGFRQTVFQTLVEDDLELDVDLLARIVRVGDDERIKQGFELDQVAWVEIRALGEGSSGDMFDYGYLKRADTGRRVWEMIYDDTEHAGGANKNRIVVDEVRLEPGSYEAVYVTDDSHSFRAWNAAQPRDPMSWGLTVRRLER